MSTSSQLIQRVENAVYHEPYMIPILFKDSKVKSGFIHSRLRRYVPHRVGIEFECFGDFANQFLREKGYKWSNFEKFESYFGLVDFSQDSSLHRIGKLWTKTPEELRDTKEEIRVSISDYRQLDGLYRVMKEMAKYCTISSDCGIHIHVDLTKYDTTELRKESCEWFNKHMSEVESIFPKYEGTYNKRIAQMGKGSYVNLSSKGTVEFRIAPLTFDYEVLIDWIIRCSKLVSRMVIECHLKQHSNKKVKRTVTKLSDSEVSGSYEIRFDPDGQVWYGLSDYQDTYDRLNVQMEALLSHLISEELARSEIEWYVESGRLVMDYPDGERAVISLEDAIDAYSHGGVSQLIRRARTTGWVGEIRNRHDNATTLLNDQLSTQGNSVTQGTCASTSSSNWITLSGSNCYTAY